MNSSVTDIIRQAEMYLTEKYHQEFQIVASIENSIDVPYTELFFETAFCPEQTITVYCQKSGDSLSFKDDYYGYLVRDEYEKKLQQILETHLREYKFFFNFTASFFPADLTGDYSLENALDTYGISLQSNIYVFVLDDSDMLSADVFSEVTAELQKNKIVCYVAIYEVSSEDYVLLTQDTYDDYLSSKYKLRPTYKETVR